jgi:hypothetical protein
VTNLFCLSFYPFTRFVRGQDYKGLLPLLLDKSVEANHRLSILYDIDFEMHLTGVNVIVGVCPSRDLFQRHVAMAEIVKRSSPGAGLRVTSSAVSTFVCEFYLGSCTSIQVAGYHSDY